MLARSATSNHVNFYAYRWLFYDTSLGGQENKEFCFSEFFVFSFFFVVSFEDLLKLFWMVFVLNLGSSFTFFDAQREILCYY